jgi:hypothetical protein
MSDVLFEPKLINAYTLTEVIKTDKFIVVIEDDIESRRFDDLAEFDIIRLEDIWEYSYDLIYLDQ